MSQQRQSETLSKIQSIINFKQLYFQERERRIELEKQLEYERVKLKKLNTVHGSIRSKTKYCSLCSNSLSSKLQLGKNENLVEELKDFSQKMSTLKFLSTFQGNMQPSIMSKINHSGENAKKHVGMIQNFAIFGTSQTTIQDFIMKCKMGNQFEGQILYSKNQKQDIELQASKFVFPSGMAIKKYSNHKAKEKTIELMSYCYTNLKSFILSFQCPDDSFSQNYHDNDLLNHVNPSHRLYCICIGIHDYTWVENNKNRLNISLGNIEGIGSFGSLPNLDEPVIKSQGHEILGLENKDSFKSIDQAIENINDLDVGITQRVFCIMSYYPFFTFFEEILRNLINIVKMERLAIYKHNQENIKLTIKQTDSKFQMERMIELFDHCHKDLQFKKVNFNKEYELRLINQQKLTFMSYWDEGKTFFTREWIYSILSMFTFESFLDVWTLMMLEDKVVFICQNSNILTHTIYLFTNVLTKPFQYPFPIVSIIPNQEDEEFLMAPMPIVYGLLKKRKSIEQRNILNRFDMTYVFLSPEKVQVIYQQNRKQLLNSRSTKLSSSKQLKQLFKDLKKTRKKQQRMARYEIQSSDYCILASNEQKQKALKIVSIINQFTHQQIAKRLPNHIEVENLKKKIDLKSENGLKDEHTYLMEVISGDIKKSVKDPFIIQLMNTQIINNYVFK